MNGSGLNSGASDKLTIVLVEDDPLIRDTTSRGLTAHSLETWDSAAKFMNQTRLHHVDLILLDLCNDADPNGQDAVNRIPQIRNRFPNAELIVQSAVGDVQVMRQTVKLGASRFLGKEHLRSEIPLLLAKISETRQLRGELDRMLVGTSPVMENLKRELLTLRMETLADVLIEGETGTGKELCARAMHSAGSFVAVNVSAIPKELFESEFFGAEKGSFTGATSTRVGYFESVGTGTLFLDEIQNLDASHQAKLLRVLETRQFKRVGSSEDRPFRGRLITATNRSLREAVAKEQFREDLYFRLSPIILRVPPLRVRRSDIPSLAEAFLAELDSRKRLGFTTEGLNALENLHDWPGNVRELKGFVRKLVVSATIPKLDRAEVEELLSRETNPSMEWASSKTSTLAPSGSGYLPTEGLLFDDQIREFERFYLARVLQDSKDPGKAWERLGLSRSRFYEKVRAYGLAKLNKGGVNEDLG